MELSNEEILVAFCLSNIPGIITQEEFDDVKKAIKELLRENKELSHIVANKVISDYDIDTPLKKELGEANLKIVSLEDELYCYKQEKEDLIKWLEDKIKVNDLKGYNYEKVYICGKETVYKEVLDKVRGINNG